MGNGLKDNNDIEVQARYRTVYNQIVQPKQIFPISRYFLDYWLPLLGPSLAWLVIALQQRCFWNQEKKKGEFWCKVSLDELAEDAGITEKTVRNLLANSPYISWFLESKQPYHYVPEFGRQVRDIKLYVVYQDDPLIPLHQTGLAVLLQQAGLDHLDKTLQALHKLPAPELIAKLTTAAAGAATGPNLTIGTVKSVVESVFNVRVEGETHRLCDAVQHRITNLSEPLLATQYFRLKWVPILGPSLGWLVIILRGECYYNPKTHEKRDVCAWRKQDLAAALGQSTKNLGRLLDDPYASEFFSAIDDESTAHRVTFRVKLWQEQEPYTPADRLILEQNGYSDISRQPDKITDRNRTKLPIEETGKPDKITDRNRTKLPIEENKSDKITGHAEAQTGQNYRTPKHLLSTSDSLEALNHHHQGNGDGDDADSAELAQNPINFQPTEASSPLSPRQIKLALRGLGINSGTNRSSKLAKEPHMARPGYLDAWLTWYTNQNAGHSQLGPGGMLQELEDGLWPPGWSDTGEPPAPPPVREIPLPPPVEVSSPENKLWQTTVLGQLQMQMTQATFDTWVKNTRVLRRDNGHLVVGAQSAFAKDWLENRLYTTIRRTVRNVFENPNLDVKFIIDPVGADVREHSTETSRRSPQSNDNGRPQAALNGVSPV